MNNDKPAPRSGVVRGDAQRIAALRAELGVRVLEAAPIMILALDTQGSVQYVNPFFEQLTGYRLDDLRGAAWIDGFLSAPDREHVRALLEQRSAGTTVGGVANPIVTRAGARREIVWTYQELRDVEARPTGVLAIGQDVTERETTPDAVRDTERAFARVMAVVAGAPIVLFALDRGGRFTFIEGRELEKLGVKPGELMGASVFEVYAEVAGLREAFDRALSGQRTLLASSVGNIEFEAWWAPSYDAGGHIDGVVGAGFDVTERKRAELELHASVTAQEHAVLELREKDRRNTDFIAMLSHELRNPLSAILSGLYVLGRAEPGGDQARRAAGIVSRQVAQLSRLVDDLLDVSRITQDKVRLQRAPIDLDRLVRAVVDDHQGLFASHGVRIEVTPGAPLMLRADAARLTQVISNLLHNAAKFTPPGGLTRVSLVRDLAAGRAVLRVVDTGVGLDPAMTAQLFQPFAQSDRTLARSKGGLGLGLTLVKGLVQLHGGEVSVYSKGPGQGAEFTVSLPLDEPADATAATPADAGRPRVLVIEDNLDAAEMMASLVELEGYTVKIAHDGSTGLRIAREFHPDIVLCDVGLPDLTGHDVAYQLKRDASLRSPLLAAVSGYAAPEDVARARAAGFDVHLAKPVTLERLRKVLEFARSQRAAGSSPGRVSPPPP